MLSQNSSICALSLGTFTVFKGDNVRAPEHEQLALLERASRFEPAALGALYDQYSARIYSYIFHRVGQAEIAEDLTGQVFMRMLEAIRSGRGWRKSFSGWLFRIAHNLVIDHYRRRHRASFVDLDENPGLHTPEGDPSRQIESRLDSERLRAALGRLTEEQALVITLRFLEDMSISEVAAQLDKSEGSIKALQYRAVLALRRVMVP